MEIVKNRKTKEPFDVKADKLSGKALMSGKIAAEAMKNGLYMAAWYDTLVIAPPLIITEEQIDEALVVLDKALEIGDQEAIRRIRMFPDHLSFNPARCLIRRLRRLNQPPWFFSHDPGHGSWRLGADTPL